MQASNFDQANFHLGPPDGLTEDDVRTLRVCKAMIGDQPVVVTCWRPTQEEIDEIQRTGRVWLLVWGSTMPPVRVTGESPWKESIDG